MCNPRRFYECRECGERFETHRSDAFFCSAAHRKAWNNRAATRGAQLYHAAMQWRTERGENGKIAMSELCHILGGFIAADKADQRRAYTRLPGSTCSTTHQRRAT